MSTYPPPCVLSGLPSLLAAFRLFTSRCARLHYVVTFVLAFLQHCIHGYTRCMHDKEDSCHMADM